MDDVLVDFCLLKLDAMIDLVAGLTDDEANARPVPGANTAYMLVSHCLGMSRNWSSTVNLGPDLHMSGVILRSGSRLSWSGMCGVGR